MPEREPGAWASTQICLPTLNTSYRTKGYISNQHHDSNLSAELSADFMNMSTENGDSSAPNENIAVKEDQGSTYMASDEDQDGYDQKYGEDSEEMRRRVAEMEEELLKISNMQQQVERQINSAADKIDENSMWGS